MRAQWLVYVGAVLLRFYMTTNYSSMLQDRIELSSPPTSFKRCMFLQRDFSEQSWFFMCSARRSFPGSAITWCSLFWLGFSSTSTHHLLLCTRERFSLLNFLWFSISATPPNSPLLHISSPMVAVWSLLCSFHRSLYSPRSRWRFKD